MSVTVKDPTGSTIATYSPTYRLKKFYCTDEDLTYGLGKCEVEIADPDGQAAATYPTFGTEKGLMYEIIITANGVTLFDGYIETVEPSYSGGDTILLTGYCKGLDFANVFVTGTFGYVGQPGSDYLGDIFTLGGRTYPHIASKNYGANCPPYPSPTASAGTLQQKYVLDIIRDVCSVTSWAGTVDPAGNFNFFKPSDGNHNINYAVQSVYPSNPTSPNDFKEGRATRNLQDTKTYLEVNGASQGYDPYITGGGLTAAAYNDSSAGGIMQWSADRQCPMTVATAGLPPSTNTTLTNYIAGIPSTFPADIRLGFGFGSSVSFTNGSHFGNTAYGNMKNAYQIKNDVDDTNYHLDIPFNNKSQVHLWENVTMFAVNPFPLYLSMQFFDVNGNFATGGQVSIPFNGAWKENVFSVPTASDLAVGANANYRYLDENGNPVSTFAFSSIVGMQFAFTTQANNEIQAVNIADVWFTCNPIYQTPIVSKLTNLTYGRRDQAVNAGSQYVNQLDVQGYGDGIYPAYANPMLRVPITVLVDPAATFFKAGYFVGMNVPRWGFTPTIMPSWRILQVRYDWGTSGLTCKLDLMPAGAA